MICPNGMVDGVDDPVLTSTIALTLTPKAATRAPSILVALASP